MKKEKKNEMADIKKHLQTENAVWISLHARDPIW